MNEPREIFLKTMHLSRGQHFQNLIFSNFLKTIPSPMSLFRDKFTSHFNTFSSETQSFPKLYTK